METRADNDKFDVVGFIIEFEDGELDDIAVIGGFQHLIDDGTVWHLQGSYGRQAHALIEAGYCTDPSVTTVLAQPKPEKIGSHCECGANYVYLERHNAWGYSCAR